MPSQDKGGFALVIALTLMAFIVLLSLSLTTMSQIETKNADLNQMMTLAQQNALLGLQVAFGDIQKELGPDQRISATASRLDTDPYDNDDYNAEAGILTTDGVQQSRQHWTGVWRTFKDSNGFPKTTFSKWLVSGYPDSHTYGVADAYLGASVFAEEKRNELINGSAKVEAGKVDIDTYLDTVSRFAYWVGDEGVKAKVNIAPPPQTANSTLSAQKFGLSAIQNLDWLPQLTKEQTGKLHTSSSFKILEEQLGNAANQSIRKHFHDLTFHGFGLFSNTLLGGLKLDLTSALYDTSNQPTGLIFAPQDNHSASAADPGGPDWKQLRSWIRTEPNAAGELPIHASSAQVAGVYPVVTGFQLYWIPTYDPADATGNRNIRVNMLPAVTLWNPYDTPLESATYTLTFGRTLMNGSDFENFISLWRSWSLIKGNNTHFPIEQPYPATFYLTSGRLEPGEAIVFSASAQTPYTFGMNPSPTGATLSRGYHPGFGFHFDIGAHYTPAETPETYRWGGQYSAYRTHALKLAKGTGPNAEPIQIAVYMTDHPKVGQDWQGNYETMQASPPANTPIIDTSNAYAYKILHTFVDNEPVWDQANANLQPNTRKWLANHNPRALIHGPNPLTFTMPKTWVENAATLNPTFIGSMQRRGTFIDVGFAPYDLDDNVTVGYSESQSDAERTILFQRAPDRADLHSIGQFMHAPLYNDLTTNTDPYFANGLKIRVRNARFGNNIPAYAVGNSLADPSISLNKVDRVWSTSSYDAIYQFQGVHHDYSYKLNAALWDRYFLSTLPGTLPENTPENNRIFQVVQNDTPRSGERVAAADLAINGAFNINSTSVEAWRAMFATFYDSNVRRADGSFDVADPDNPKSPILRIDTPIGPPGVTPDSQDTATFIGYRTLDPAQIDALADSIVEEIKLRGPFASLAHFINRMPDTDGTYSENTDAYRLQGTLAAALDKSGVNSGLQQNVNLAAQNTGITGMQAQAESGWRTENLPGWLSQADLLARMGSTLSARSDTFRVRAYGEAINPITGETVSARCEAIIQRIPEYVDSLNNPPETPYDAAEASAQGYAPLTQTNLSFGRRFVILDFHWLEDSDV
ncbi:hypothetical protein SH580_16880 [Coraliomargarita algicola]|uniref:Verru_Chthon cassette protein A n=1 Tax=Coraliomargarita algicola TaxID=3092156 RepID=A0ABZ0RIA1_9BACT|nr:hypothetical protein [Coraliomargarita sp. J2-16]WPJ95101.1 hypothetical protein SH580_16880 [Coraliomargarita sp. J2-16]